MLLDFNECNSQPIFSVEYMFELCIEIQVSRNMVFPILILKPHLRVYADRK